jgi:hypothetical protein
MHSVRNIEYLVNILSTALVNMNTKMDMKETGDRQYARKDYKHIKHSRL